MTTDPRPRARQLLAAEPDWPQMVDDGAMSIIAELCDALDAATDPELAALLMKNADRYDKRFGYKTLMGEQMRAAARKLGGTP